MKKIVSVFLLGIACAWNCAGSSCMAPYGSYYQGLVMSADKTTTYANVMVREARSGKKAPSRLTLTVTDLMTGCVQRFIAHDCAIPAVFSAVAEGETARDDGSNVIKGLANWNYILGTWGDKIVVASMKGVSDLENVSFSAMDMLNGYWTFAFRTVPRVGSEGLAGTVLTCGDIACSLNIKANSKKYKLTVMMPDGWKWTYSGKLLYEGGKYIVSAMKKRKANGGTESFGFTIAIDEETFDFSVVEASPWVVSGGKLPFENEPQLVAFGYPVIPKADFKKCEISISDESFAFKTKSLNATSGIVGGSAKYSYVSENGKAKTKSAKIWGVDVNGVCYGSAWVTRMASSEIEFSRYQDEVTYE